MSNEVRNNWRAMVVPARIAVTFAMAGFAETHPTVASTPIDAEEEPVRLLSAFFGLDNGLPFRRNLPCLGCLPAEF